ncbi:hypothetical protein F4821DRAFT_165992 [Hypoxylon rubiginosum]|uniref:Uncharacterized protein n=1 Tax=Hypoxylon rubiginosum TaxID=110542 RepID=A0ACC0CW29_9PEZI|nr:hypothetical protein F4821DRAFT_165992 [Hypoxylon rubiginosum]
MLFNIVSLLAFGAIVAAVPAQEADCPRIRCIDGVSKCGIKYGHCYDMCTQAQPGPPPCPEEPTTITTVVPTTTSSASVCTSTGTACADYIKECGSPPTAVLTYGGCFPACGPTPTFTPPPCPVANSTTIAKPTA